METLSDWLIAGAPDWVLVLVSTVICYAGVTIFVFISGLRSFSKMSSTEFVTTVAVGSLTATIIVSPTPSVIVGLCVLASVFLVKWAAALARSRTDIANRVPDNRPRYLRYGDEIPRETLNEVNVSLSEMHAKLPEANVWSYEQLVAAVLETTGDVSVLHRTLDDATPSPEIFADMQKTHHVGPRHSAPDAW